jgi:manganese/zinc/iron transport system ATP- binding protein
MGLFKRPRQADLIAVDYYIEMVGLTAFADRQISQLSGGQQQRAFLARALIQEASIYFMDEPFTGVDAATEGELVAVFQKLKEKKTTVFVVHHDLSTVSEYYDWLIVLNMRLIASGPVKEVLTEEVLHTAYGKNLNLFGEALHLSQNKLSGD